MALKDRNILVEKRAWRFLIVTLREILQKLRPLLDPPPQPPKPEIGFHVKEDPVPYRTSKRVKA